MKKTFKTIASLVMMLVLLLGIGVPAYAAGNVTYRGGAEWYVSPGSGYTDTDLFDGFKNVMPGDVLDQKITVTNNRLRGSVNIYLRAVAHDEENNPLSKEVAATGETVATMTEFLNQLDMEVKQGDKVIFSAKADQLDGLQDNVLLGNFVHGSTTELTVTLKTDIEKMDNDFANRVGEVDWVFTAEELDPQGNPKTGDTSNLTLWIVVMVVCLAAIAVVAFLILKKKKAK